MDTNLRKLKKERGGEEAGAAEISGLRMRGAVGEQGRFTRRTRYAVITLLCAPSCPYMWWLRRAKGSSSVASVGVYGVVSSTIWPMTTLPHRLLVWGFPQETET